MKIAGYILLAVQVLSLIGVFTGTESLSGHIFAWYIGRFIFGIVGIALLLIARKRAKRNGCK